MMTGALETGNNGKPITWVGATDAPGRPGDPTHISIAIATTNYQSDQGKAPTFTNPFPSAFVPLLNAAEQLIESVANIHFDTVADIATSRVNAADIRVGVSALGENPKTMGFIGDTVYSWDANNKFQPDTVVAIEDPAEKSVTALTNGDFRYNGFQTTVFQDLIHELLHAVGLAHNPNDPTAIMNPVLSTKNPLPDTQDVAALQSLYGLPTQAVAGNTSVLATLLS